MPRILICDDDAQDLARVQGLVQEYYGDSAELGLFSSAEELFDNIRSGAKAELLLLDILMPGMSGMSLAAELRRSGFEGQIVFITARTISPPRAMPLAPCHICSSPWTKRRLRRCLTNSPPLYRRTRQAFPFGGARPRGESRFASSSMRR